jgi:arylsulfatase A-like enzyme
MLCVWGGGEGGHIGPTVKDLALNQGVVLQSAYSYKYCSPTRGSFLSGRLPFKLDATRCNIIPWTITDGLDLDYTLLHNGCKRSGTRHTTLANGIKGCTSLRTRRWRVGLTPLSGS